jgi:predicted nucleic acid-binding protein
MYLLDTDVVSELRKAHSGNADPNVAAWSATAQVGALYISVVTILELEIGVIRIERRDAAQGGVLRAWLEGRVLPAFDGRVLPIDAPVTRRCAPLHVPNRLPYRDAFIAATALVHGMTVVTRNVADFVSTGVALLNPWQPRTS